MSRIYEFGAAALKRPITWLLGVIGAAIAAYLTNSLKPVESYISGEIGEISCAYRQTAIANDSQFTILISPLAHDPDRSNTERVMRAFLGEKGFRVIPICESLNFDFSADLQTATDEALKRARELIRARNADLLLFGEVVKPDDAVQIYATNENGGCDLQPKPIIIDHGNLPGDFSETEKRNLIDVSIKEIESACLSQFSFDLSSFSKRMNKMESFMQGFPLEQPKNLAIAVMYIDAMRILYSNTQENIWFSRGYNLSNKIFQSGIKDGDLGLVFGVYASLIGSRYEVTHKDLDKDAALKAYSKAINLDANIVSELNNRGVLYYKSGDFELAIADFDRALQIDGKSTFAFLNRGSVYLDKGDPDTAIADFDSAIALDPKLAIGYSNRGNAYSAKGDLGRAFAEYDEALHLNPQLAIAYANRSIVDFKKGDMDLVISDATQAIRLNPSLTSSYMDRGNAYFNKGDLDRAIADYNNTIRVDPKFAKAYFNRGTAYFKKGDFSQAIADYDLGMSLDPGNDRAKQFSDFIYRDYADRNFALWKLVGAASGMDDFRRRLGLD